MRRGRSAAAWATSWLVALRISRREVLRHRARNLLIVAMLALPVFGVSAIDTILSSADQLSTQEQLTRAVGGTDARIDNDGNLAIYQTTDANPTMMEVDPSQATIATGAAATAMPPPQEFTPGKAVVAALPGATFLSESIASGTFAHGPSGYATGEYVQIDLRDKTLSGAFDVQSGRVPQTSTEIDVSPAEAAALGVGIGGRVNVPGTSTQSGKAVAFTVVGVMQQPGDTRIQAIFALPSAPTMTNESTDSWYVRDSGGVDWNQVKQLNKSGYLVISRAVVLNPPPASQVPYNQLYASSCAGCSPPVSVDTAAVVGIAVGIALLEVILLAGPAFAVSARRREREYAMLGASGADRSHLRRIVLADGLVLGALAGVLGAGLGIGAGAVALALPYVTDYTHSVPGAVHVNALHIVGVALLAMILGLCSAYVPARAASRRDISATLSGRRESATRRVRRGRLALGVVFVAAGLGGVYFCKDVGQGSAALVAVAGIALVEVGGILCTPAIVRFASSLGRFLPLGPRLALRDSSRHMSRTTPAVAAMFAAVAGAVAAGGWLVSSLDRQQAAYEPMLRPNQVAVAGLADSKQAAQILADLRAAMPVTGSILTHPLSAAAGTKADDNWEVSIVPPGVTESWEQCGAAGITMSFLGDAGTQMCGSALESTSAVSQELVGDAQTFREITGLNDAAAQAALNEGGLVMFSPGVVQGGKAQVNIDHQSSSGHTTTTTRTLPAAYVQPDGFPNPGFIISPAAATALGFGANGTESLLVDLSSHVTATQQYSATQILGGLGIQTPLQVETGLQTKLGLANWIILAVAMLLAVGAAAIATGLALADGRADQETLSAVGGSPWTRRALAGSTALVITGLGVLIGVPVGLAVSEGLVRVSGLELLQETLHSFDPSRQPLQFAVPWLDLGLLGLAVPLLTVAGAVAFSRSRPPSGVRAVE